MPMETCMPRHRSKLVPAIFALLSLAVSCAATARAVHAAPCIAKPNAAAPQGEHWYYRTNRATGRQCWYLAPEDNGDQKGATQASDQPATDASVQPAAPQRAQRQAAPAPAVAPVAPDATFP